MMKYEKKVRLIRFMNSCRSNINILSKNSLYQLDEILFETLRQRSKGRTPSKFRVYSIKLHTIFQQVMFVNNFSLRQYGGPRGKITLTTSK